MVGTVNVFEAVRPLAPAGLAFASSAAVYGNPAAHPAGLVADNSPLMPDSFYGVYKAANGAPPRSMRASTGWLGGAPAVDRLRPRPRPGNDVGPDQGHARRGRLVAPPYQVQRQHAAHLCAGRARASIASARAAAGSGETVSLNVPGRRIGVPALAGLIDEILPGTGRLVTWGDNSLPVPSLLAPPAGYDDAVGDVPNIALADWVRETIKGFQDALAAGLDSPPQP